MIGFAHAFTPYFGIYAKYDSYKDCYGSRWKDIHFLELGLSADTSMADRIGELHNLTFLSNSDAHSPWLNKLGREFNKLRMKEISFDEVRKALKREGGRGSILNVGFNPLEGKYHKTRCTGCLLFFKPKEAAKFKWRCPSCGRPIKKGVDFRIEELATVKENVHPGHRPKYVHIIPLSEIIAESLGISNAWSVKVQDTWKEFVRRFGNEIRVLLEVPVDEIRRVNAKTGDLISAFREGKYRYIPGGAGVYGVPVPPGKEFEIKYYKHRQKNLAEF